MRIRRRAWLVLVVTAAALALAAVSVRDLQPTYTNRIALTVGSPNRAPDQDAVLSVGYAQYFEDPAYQSKLKAVTGVPDAVSLQARTVASSPILFIEATAATAGTALDAAQKAGAAFRDEINASLRAAQDAAIAAVRKPFDDIRAANGVVNDVSLTQMQDQINRINADTSNKLIDLQLSSEVVRTEPVRWPTLLGYGVGGLLLGGVAALVAGALSRRLRTADDVEQKAGVPAIAVVPGDSRKPRARGGSDAPRDRALRQVVTAVGLAVPVTRAAVACTAPDSTPGVETVARTIARERARQGVRTILVHADLRHPRGIGVAELLAGRIGIDAVLTATPMPNLHEVFPGSTGEDPFTALSRERFARLLDALHERADFVVIMAPPVLEAVETQVIAAAAGSTVLILDRATARTGPARKAIRVLAAVDAAVLGAVLIDVRGEASATEPGAIARVPAIEAPAITAGRGPE
ncbi:hypothetical protein ABZ319_23165 [Nocardia sp. NPDC005978]|uniref:hypothetical protein n=1 Tax=Nocardia sp. NPDC005978 TaxID=3156725 RepID=UPI0033AAB920